MVETPPSDFVGVVHDATGIEAPVIHQVAAEIWNTAVRPRIDEARRNVDLYGAKAPLPGGDLLTDREYRVLDSLSEVVKGFSQIYDADITRGDSKTSTHNNDMNEVVAHIHDLQARILSRAAARAYPGRYRLL